MSRAYEQQCREQAGRLETLVPAGVLESCTTTGSLNHGFLKLFKTTDFLHYSKQRDLLDHSKERVP
jgi:hypothetical protein